MGQQHVTVNVQGNLRRRNRRMPAEIAAGDVARVGGLRPSARRYTAALGHLRGGDG